MNKRNYTYTKINEHSTMNNIIPMGLWVLHKHKCYQNTVPLALEIECGKAAAGNPVEDLRYE